MGYTSEVAIKCEEKAYELFKEVFTQEQLYVMPDKIYKDDSDYILYWDWVKWYEDFEGVKTITGVMSKLDMNYQDQDGYGYIFIRLGEDYTDVECRRNNSDIDLGIVSYIDIPKGLEEVS